MPKLLPCKAGWNELIDPLINQLEGLTALEAQRKIADAHSRVLASPTLLSDLGVSDDLTGFLRTLAAYAHGSTITIKDFRDLCESEHVDPKVVGTFGDLVGLFSFSPDEGLEHSLRRMDINAFALAALTRPE